MAPTPVLLGAEQTRYLRLAPGEAAFREGSTTIVLPDAEAAFLNPVQHFNRDVSTLAIRTWSEERDATMRRRAEERRTKGVPTGRKKKKQRGEQGEEDGEGADTQTQAPPPWRPQKFTILEALSATGLRSIRYAHEIPLLRTVYANDISPSAVEAIRRNVALNFPDDGLPLKVWEPGVDASESAGETQPPPPDEDAIMAAENDAGPSTAPPTHHPHCKVRISQGDATSLMYTHRGASQRFDVIDLDPYGSAVPFLDGAVQAVADDGLLCVTCTDLAVLAGHNYPEKAYSTYGGVSTRSEYVHEVALRLVLHAISSAAARYGRAITPLVSLSIDFYLRVFVRVTTSPKQVKALASHTGTLYVCSGCFDYAPQFLGRTTDRRGGGGGDPKYSSALGPPVAERCRSCGFRYHVAGPMYLGALHDASFCGAMLRTLAAAPQRFDTAPRIAGMVGLAAAELPRALFYFTPAKVSGLFHCPSPPLALTASALLHAGYDVSRSHAQPGSLKTNASRQDITDMMRTWIRLRSNVPLYARHKLAPKSPSYALAMQPPRALEAGLLRHVEQRGEAEQGRSTERGQAELGGSPKRGEAELGGSPKAADTKERDAKGSTTDADANANANADAEPWWIDETHFLAACTNAPAAAPTPTSGIHATAPPTLWHIHPSLPLHPSTHRVLADSGGAGLDGSSDALPAVKGVRYQENPLPHWGPGTAARGGGVAKKKRAREEEA